MKQITIILFALFLSISLASQIDPMQADTVKTELIQTDTAKMFKITTIQLLNGAVNTTAFDPVDSTTHAKFIENYFIGKMRQASMLRQQADILEGQAAYAQAQLQTKTGQKPEDLGIFKQKLESLIGAWQVKTPKDDFKIEIQSEGIIKAGNKSGTVKIISDFEIEISIAGVEVNLFEKTPDLWISKEKENVKMQRTKNNLPGRVKNK